MRDMSIIMPKVNFTCFRIFVLHCRHTFIGGSRITYVQFEYIGIQLCNSSNWLRLSIAFCLRHEDQARQTQHLLQKCLPWLHSS